MATEQAQPNALENFSFSEDTEWFGVKTQADTPDEQVVKEIKQATKVAEEDDSETEEVTDLEDKPKETSKVKPKETKEVKGEKEKEKEPTFFDQEEDQTNEVEDGKVKTEKEDKDKGEDDDKFFTTLAEEMKAKGIFQNVEIPADTPVTEEQFFEYQDKEIESRVDETFQTFFEELDEEGAAFLKFKRDGGKSSDFISVVNSYIDVSQLNLEEESDRNKVIAYYLTTVENLEGDELTDRVAWLKETNKEKAYAEKWANTIAENKKEEIAQLTVKQEKLAKKKQEDAKAFAESLQKVALKSETIKSFPISKTEQKELPNYFTKATVKTGKKYVPGFQADLSKVLKAETEEDMQNLLLLGKLLKNGFDTSEVTTTVKTKVAKVAQSKLQEAKSSAGLKSSTAGRASNRSLGDFFED